MAALYRLTCPNCSVEIQVSLTQAGGTASCDCGDEVQIPKMLDLKRLPLVEQTKASRTKSKAWPPIQGAVFGLGVFLIALGGYLHVQLAPERQGLQTEQPEFPEFQGDIGMMTEIQAWGSWLQLRTLKLQERDTPDFIKNRVRFKVLTNYLYFAWTLAAIGGVLIVISMFLGRPPQSGQRGSK